MGISWSKQSTDYEKILSSLNIRIGELEATLNKTRHGKRRATVWIISYGSLLYILYMAWVFLYPRGPPLLSYRPLLDTLGLVGGPLIIYAGRWLVNWLYGRKIGIYEERLRDYRAQQRIKVEELKEMTSYYKTKGLIERFDPDAEAKPEGKGAEMDRNMSSKGSLNNEQLRMNAELAKHDSLPPQDPLPPPPPPVPIIYTPTWLDRLVDSLIGDDRASKYALICQKCYSHNGLARPDELDSIQYICPNCHHFNLPQRPMSAITASRSTTGAIQKQQPSSVEALDSDFEVDSKDRAPLDKQENVFVATSTASLSTEPDLDSTPKQPQSLTNAAVKRKHRRRRANESD